MALFLLKIQKIILTLIVFFVFTASAPQLEFGSFHPHSSSHLLRHYGLTVLKLALLSRLKAHD